MTSIDHSCSDETELRILVAEDSRLHQRLAESVLRGLGCIVTVACNGRKAVEEFNSHEFDLVLMDIEMPEMDGIQATVAIRGIEGDTGRHTPIVAVTSTGDLEECLAAGMDGHIIKPLTAVLLNQEIARLEICVPPTATRNRRQRRRSRQIGSDSHPTPHP